MEKNEAITAFWQAYCATRPDGDACREESYDAWPFGDDSRMADALGALVRDGSKTATAGLIWEDEHFGWKTPDVGDKTIILDGKNWPLCIIETTAVAIKPFIAVDEAFARREGEGFTSVADWRRTHWRYFSRRCAAIGRTPTEEMPVCCQEFRVVYSR